MNIAIVYGSVRAERQGIKLARFLERQCTQRGHETTLIDPKEHTLPLLDRMYKEYDGDAPETMQRLHELFDAADAFLVVSAEYNHSVPPALKNILDHFQSEFVGKPSAIACYSAGSFGGVRVAMHLRALLPELGMPTIPTVFPVSRIGESFAEDGSARDEAYERRVGTFLDELEWYGTALKQARSNTNHS